MGSSSSFSRLFFAALQLMGYFSFSYLSQSSITLKSINNDFPRKVVRDPVQVSEPQPTSSLPDFLEWAQQVGVKGEKVKPSNFDGLRGMAVTEKIRAGDDFITVPNSKAIVTTTDQVNPMPDILNSEDWRTAKWYLRLALLLLQEKSLGQQSNLFHYVQQLPASFSTPFHWSEEDIERLNYPFLQNQIAQQRSNWTALHSQLSSNNPGFPFSFDDLVWAMECAYSRTFSGPYEGRSAEERILEVAFLGVLAIGSYELGFASANQVLNGAFAVLLSIPLRDFFNSKMLNLKRYAMCPMIDFINHKSSIESDVSYNYFKDHFAVFTKNDFETGDQVYISYGKKSNDYLLQYYGFVEQNNPYDDYTLTSLPTFIQKAAEEGKIDSTRLALVEKAGLLESLDQITFKRDGSFDELSILPALRLLLISDEELSDKQLQDISIREGILEPVSSKNENACLELLVSSLQAELQSFGQGVKQEKSIIKKMKASMSEAEICSRLFRIEKMSVLQDISKKIKVEVQ
mmetsp:Transcript_11782/g.15376  ORF Transcript_11782/g.15376 Transcript_11782/m.15376 type:complete len:516 (+) Transcript_11782:46-1593(+)|eukprot:CAMPEP_0117754078 /NCGR_PEP_ID=MMETSP0947-20121206/12616_1 /TAXON_ID=44440 /ORGANISM="Chattonella subsalsa, Strain CCMP2191" /LENGTH=515 /DNA_ID=CAMNT_0005573101 /DNA_START=46 /DNA_END=1593 /DNA_ORIENTATION=-